MPNIEATLQETLRGLLAQYADLLKSGDVLKSNKQLSALRTEITFIQEQLKSILQGTKVPTTTNVPGSRLSTKTDQSMPSKVTKSDFSKYTDPKKIGKPKTK